MKQQVFDPAFWDTEIRIQKSNLRILPLQKGAKVQSFEMEVYNSSNLKSVEKRMSDQYCKTGIKVFSFLPNCSNEYVITHLSRLKESAAEIKALGGETALVVNAGSEQILDFLHEENPSFSLIKDQDFKIAKKFGVYDEQYQPWQYISGIHNDGPFPGIFVVNRKSEICYSYVDLIFEKPFSYLEVAAAVYSEKQKIIWQNTPVLKGVYASN